MKKLKFKKTEPDLTESGLENTAEQETENTEEAPAEKKKEKPVKIKRKLEINKRAVFIGIMIMIIIFVLLFIRYGRHYDERSTEKDTSRTTLEIREDISEKEPVVLTKGTFVAGVDIPPGRYLVTVSRGFGGFVTYELGTNYPEVSEMIGYYAEPAHVPSVAVTLKDKQRIEVTGEQLKNITFTPLETKFLTELTTGTWIVGQDIKPGTYTVRSKNGLSGRMTVLEMDAKLKAYMPVANVDLGETGTVYKEEEIVSIIEGQKIRISNIPTVEFKKK